MRSALITGAAGGFGRSIVAALPHDGLDVFACDLAPAPGIHPMDVTQEADVSAAFDAAEKKLGPLSVLVTCAGVMPSGKASSAIIDMPLDEWEDTFAVNTRGTFLCLREFLRRRAAEPIADARVVLMSSAAAQLGGYRGSASYVASKAAILGLTKSAAREAAAYQVTVNCIAAGPVRTGMFDVATTSESADALARRIPLGRIGEPEDVTAAVRYLISPQAAWVTGTTLDVNGGYRMQ